MSTGITSYILIHIFFSISFSFPFLFYFYFLFFEKTKCNEIKNEPAQEQADNRPITLR